MNRFRTMIDMHPGITGRPIQFRAARSRIAPCLPLILLLVLISCGWPLRSDRPAVQMVLTTEKLLEIHDDVRFTRFFYSDGLVESGLMLHWMPDSIRIQERGQPSLKLIPAAGLDRIETVARNRMLEGFGIGTLVAGAYFLVIRGYELGAVTFGEAIAKLLVPPSIIITGMAIGAGRDKIEIFVVPPKFQFDYEQARKAHPPRR